MQSPTPSAHGTSAARENAVYDILVLGEINVDLILGPDARPTFGQVETLVGDATLTVGGSGTIFAMGAAQLGLRVAYCGVVGDDDFGRFMLDALHRRHIDTHAVIVDPAQKTGCSVILNMPGDRAILTYLGTIDALTAEQVDPALLDRTRHIHVASYFLQTRLQPGLPALLADARRRGVTVSLDTNWDPSEQWQSGLDDVLAQTDVFLPNAAEACAITGQASVEAALADLAARVPTVAIKCGGDGAIAQQGSVTARDPGFAVDVVDTTGAGDSFDGGFLYGYLNGESLDPALALACACGAHSTQAPGGTTAQATLDQARALVRSR